MDLFLGFKVDPDSCNLRKKDPYGLIPIIERTVSSGVIESTKLTTGNKSFSLSSVVNQSGPHSTVFFRITDITKQEQEYAEEKRRSKILEMLVDIANSASRHETIDQLCKYAISSIAGMLDFEYGAVFVIDSVTDSIEIYSENITTSEINQSKKLYFNLDDNMTQELIRSKTECFSDSNSSDPSDPCFTIMKSLRLGTLIIVSFQINHEKYGSLVIGSIKNVTLGLSEIQLSRTVSTQLGMALDRHLLLDTLKQRYKMVENANRTKDELITMIGHELKTPLTSIVGYIELLDIDKHNLNQKQREFVTTLHHQSDVLSWLVSGINLLAMLKTNKYTLEKESLELGKVLQRLQGRFTRPENRSEITIKSSIDEDTIIKTDITAFLGICTNLFTAFERFSNLESQIDLSISKSGEDVIIDISDNSNPIGNEDLEKIYEMFSILSTKPSTINRGTVGLPLSIVKEFTDLLGGNIWFHSLPSGNKVIVILPGVF
ncbi:MAG: HAMP domain-containing histidine kinase [Caldiserica bacterium]|nr:HAMP domain-containing histidine kinase [Caldisericota bacterium]